MLRTQTACAYTAVVLDWHVGTKASTIRKFMTAKTTWLYSVDGHSLIVFKGLAWSDPVYVTLLT